MPQQPQSTSVTSNPPNSCRQRTNGAAEFRYAAVGWQWPKSKSFLPAVRGLTLPSALRPACHEENLLDHQRLLEYNFLLPPLGRDPDTRRAGSADKWVCSPRWRPLEPRSLSELQRS